VKGLTDLVGQRVTVYSRPDWGDMQWHPWITGKVRALAIYPAASTHDTSAFHFLVQLEVDHTVDPENSEGAPYHMQGALLHVILSTNTTVVPEAA
jgi:hypothetical protein